MRTGAFFFDAELFVPDVGVSVNRWLAVEARVEGEAARVVVVAVGDGDTGESVKAYAQGFCIGEEDIGCAGIHKPAVAVGHFNENGDAVLFGELV